MMEEEIDDTSVHDTSVHDASVHDADDHGSSVDDAGAGELNVLLRGAGLRPTRQRLALGALLFGKEDRHVTAEILHEEVVAGGEQVSLATVYNTLHQFRRAGLLREIAIDGSKTYFDTNTSNHSHFFVEAEGRLMDIPGDAIAVAGVPEPPAGLQIAHIDVVVRLTQK